VKNKILTIPYYSLIISFKVRSNSWHAMSSCRSRWLVLSID